MAAVAPTSVLSGTAAGFNLVESFPMRILYPMSTKIEVQFKCQSAQNMFAVIAFPVALHSSAICCSVDRKEKHEE